MSPLAMLLWAALPASGATCAQWGDADTSASVEGGPTESSGVAASRTREGVLFTHDDSGGEPILFAFRPDGTLEGEHLVRDASQDDWEDLAAAPCPDVGDCLYIGDIGDNDGTRAQVTVYVVPEPGPGEGRIRTRARYIGVYPDGPRDAETLLVHPCTGGIFLVTRDGDGASEVYRFPLGVTDGEVHTLERIASLPVEGVVETDRAVTAGDWGPDGEQLALRTGGRALWWATDPDRPNAHWSDPPEELPLPGAPDGEGLAWSLDGGLVATSEGQPMGVTVVPCADSVPAADACVFPQTGRSCGCAGSVPASGSASWVLALLATAARRRSRRG